MKKISILSALFLLGLGVSATPLTPQQALNRVSQLSPRGIKSLSKGSPRLVHTRLSPDDQPALYVFDNASAPGYMILSADDSTRPLLGYSDQGKFDVANMSPEMEWWLNEYALQIAYASQQARESSDPFRMAPRTETPNREAIAPMIKTKWDQIAPYNDQCPLSGTERTYTGCVATAMAQVMKYWEYPEKGTGTITYSIESLEKKVSMNFASKSFDWKNMKDAYLTGSYTQEESDAVAYLMKACGYAVKMQYSLDASGALGMNIPNAFSKYFQYDPNIFYTLRSYYSEAEWDKMMYENLRDVGPVLVGGGSAMGGGHSFVCDGYDGEGFYHFNWGWSGMSDGYFALDALNPDALGAGGGSGGGYNFSQDAVFNLQPPTGQPANPQTPFFTQTGGVEGTINGTLLSFSLNGDAETMWVNYTPTTLKVKFGVQITDNNDASTWQPIYRDISKARFQIQPGYGTSPDIMKASLDLSQLNLPDGTYTITMGSCPVSDDNPTEETDGTGFIAVKPYYGYDNYITLKVENGAYAVTNYYKPQLKVSAEIISPLYYCCLMTLKVTATNDSEIELSSGFAPAFANSAGVLFLGESISVSVPPHSTVTREWTTDLEQFQQLFSFDEPMTLAFTLFNEDTFTFYTDQFVKNVQMQPNPGTPKISISTPVALPGTLRETFHQGGVRQARYIVTDPLNIQVTAGVTLNQGYFHYPMVACLCQPYDGEQVEIALTSAQSILLSEPGDSADFSTVLGYPVYDPDITYYMILAYSGAQGLVPVANPLLFRIDEAAGIEELGTAEGLFICYDRQSGLVSAVSDSDIVSLEAYDINGISIAGAKTFNGNIATVTIPGESLVIVSARDSSGNVKTTKVIK